MTTVTIPNLPAVTSLNGTEPLLGVQSNTSVRITTAQIASLAVGASGNLPWTVSVGGTGVSTFPVSNGILIGNGTNALTQIAAPTGTNYILVGSSGGTYSWQPTVPVTAGVDSVSFGTTGLTPASAQSGVVSVAFGTVPTAAGIYSPSTNQIALSTASTQRLLIDSTGAATFSTSVTSPLLIATASLTTPLVIGGSTASSTLTLESTSGAGTSDSIIFKTGSQVERMRIDTNGNVGIGTTSPQQKLDVRGNMIMPSGFIFGSLSGTTTGSINLCAGPSFNTGGASIATRGITNGYNNGGIEFYTGSGATGAEVMRIDSSGNVSIGGSGTQTAVNLLTNASITGATSAYAHYNVGVIQSGVTNFASAFYSNIAAAAASFTITEVDHFIANPNTGGAGSTITTQIGFNAAATLATAGAATITNAYGFAGNIAAGTNRWNLYMGGSANNYMAGNLGIGSTNLTAYNLNVGANITGATTAASILINGAVQSGVTSLAVSAYSAMALSASTTTSSAVHFYANPNPGGAGSTIGIQYGFVAESSLGTVGAATVTTAIGYAGNIASGTNRWNLYMAGTANNYMAGALGVGTTTVGVAGSINAIGAITFQTTTNNQSYTTTGAGTITISSGTAGSINNMSIGATTASTGAFTTVTAPTMYGGTTASSTLTLESTSGAGTSDSIIFKTGSQSTRMTIDTNGNVGIGTTSATVTNGGIFNQAGSISYVAIGHANGTASGNWYANFQYAGTTIGTIAQNGTTGVLYNITSDQRLKTNIVDAPSASSIIDAIQIRSFDWKSDGSHNRYGVIAQELNQLVPEAVHTPIDENEMMGVDYSKLVPLLVKALQELKAEFDAYKASHP